MLELTGKVPKKLIDAAKRVNEAHPGAVESIEMMIDDRGDFEGIQIGLNGYTVDNEGQHIWNMETVEQAIDTLESIRPCECEECADQTVESKVKKTSDLIESIERSLFRLEESNADGVGYVTVISAKASENSVLQAAIKSDAMRVSTPEQALEGLIGERGSALAGEEVTTYKITIEKVRSETIPD